MRYQLPVASRVRLTIYNMLGEVVKVLVDETQEAGYKEAVWNASGYASGVYFYRLEARSVTDASVNYQDVKKAILVK